MMIPPGSEGNLADLEAMRLFRWVTDHGNRPLTSIKHADGFNLDYTDEYAFTDLMSSMVADNLGNTQSLIGQVSASCKNQRAKH